jgi:TolB protein
MIKHMAVLSVSLISCVGLHAQEMFPATQLTSEASQEGFPTWSPDSKFIVYSLDDRGHMERTGLWKMTPDGSGREQIYSGLAEHPKWSPDGRYIVFDAEAGKSIKMIPAKGGDPIDILPESVEIFRGGVPVWSPDSRQLAFLEGGTMNLCTAHVETGKTARILHEDGILPFPGGWFPDGQHILVALMDRQTRRSTLWKISADGKKRTQISGHHENLYRHMGLSPDGNWLVYSAMEGRELGLWIMPAKGGTSIPFSVIHSDEHPAHNESPVWSPDGQQIAFTSTRKGSFDVWRIDVDMNKVREAFREGGQ